MNNNPQSPKNGSRYNLRKRKKKNKKLIPQSDSDTDESDSDYNPNLNESDEEFNENEEFALREWQRFLGKMFPSKYTSNRNNKLEKMDKLQEEKSGKKSKKNFDKNYDKALEVLGKKERKKEKLKIKNDEIIESEDEEEDEETEFIEEDEYDDEAYIEDFLNNPNMKVNVIFTVGENMGLDEESDDVEEEEEKHIELNIGDIIEAKEKNKWERGKISKIKKEKYKVCLLSNNVKKYFTRDDIRPCDKRADQEAVLKELEDLVNTQKEKGNNEMIEKFKELVNIQTKEKEKIQKEENKKIKNENNKQFKKLINKRNRMCDFKYFKGLEVKKQRIILEQLKDIHKHSKMEKPYRMSLIETDIPTKFKLTAFNKITTLSQMDSASGEYYKIKQWVDTFMHIPFGKFNSLPINIDNGVDKCQAFMEKSRNTLDEAVYGLNDAKMQILQMVGQWISNPNSVGTAIAIHGPMGTGKTTLVKEGISKILNRPFAFISLGGATDSSFLEGHSYTYEGSTWGKIVDILIQSKCMNPVIYFDELDKISETPKGEEIIGILTHLTDTTQNSQFHDKYYSGLDFDLSKALFIFSYNDEKKINPILKDRMYRIATKGYTSEQKIIIAKKYLIPSIEKNINFKKDEINISDDALNYITKVFTEEEKGVRNLKRCLEIIYTKINLFRFMRPDSELFENEMKTLKVTFPFTIKKDIIDKLLKKEENKMPFGLYI